VAVGAAGVGPHRAQGQVEALAAGVPLHGDRAALGDAVAQHQLAIVVQPDLREQAQVRGHLCMEMTAIRERETEIERKMFLTSPIIVWNLGSTGARRLNARLDREWVHTQTLGIDPIS